MKALVFKINGRCFNTNLGTFRTFGNQLRFCSSNAKSLICIKCRMNQCVPSFMYLFILQNIMLTELQQPPLWSSELTSSSSRAKEPVPSFNLGKT